MPMNRNKGEKRADFISRCMSRENDKFHDEKQRYAVCMSFMRDEAMEYEQLTAQINEDNRAIVAEYWGLGPENASEMPDANKPYWDEFAKSMMVDPSQSRRMLCANCEYFDNTPEALAKMEAVPFDNYDIDGGGRGYCVKFDFICHNLRTCRAWERKDFENPDMEESKSAELQDSNESANNSVMTHKFLDKAEISKSRKTRDGYVTARAKAVRSGVQLYRAAELGDAAISAGFSAGDLVRVMRPDNEVFAADSVATFVHAPVTIGHPAEMVDADNWKEYSVGEVGAKVMRDGEFLALDLVLKDAAAIAQYSGGVKELSAGYTADIEFVDGVDGYDAVMKNIRINHLALVPKGRANTYAKDGMGNWGIAPLTSANEVPKMEMKAVVFGDKAVQVAASDADTVTAHIAALDKQVGELSAKLADAEAKVLSDEQIQEKAKAIADAMSRREKVKAKLGDAADKLTDAQIEGALAVIDAIPGADDKARMAMGDAMKGKMSEENDPWAAVNAKKKGAK